MRTVEECGLSIAEAVNWELFSDYRMDPLYVEIHKIRAEAFHEAGKMVLKEKSLEMAALTLLVEGEKFGKLAGETKCKTGNIQS